MKQQLKIWELSLLIALCATLCTGLFARAEQNRLAGELIRLHVVADSDSPSDQSAKLAVRDAVLAALTPRLEGVSDTGEAERVIGDALPELCRTARESLLKNGKFYGARAEICLEDYPTRSYGNFALPPGSYVSLKIILGDGNGQNWWCVVFPPLCMTAAEEADVFSGLSEDSAGLIRLAGTEYRVKFRLIELYERLRQVLS
ncbi:MAG: stage II sporulation protein R [Oscillospiraceae bacterium]|jgi:stage II sporulation protein R|nr:stage II sporulation protein R [Oscillospiraceae bacterium]